MAISVRSGDREWLKQASEVCCLAVIYEDAPCRDAAIQLCDRLLHHFRGDLSFDASWWQFRFLSDPWFAQQAGAAASRSDIILVAGGEPDELAVEVKVWFERWVAQRVQPGGALAWLPGTSRLRNARGGPSTYLQGLARRAQRDFLPLTPPAPEEEELPGISAAATVWETTASNSALEAKYHSSGWGINE